MTYLWKFVRTIMAIAGGFLVYGAVGTSDYYLIELRQPEPASVNVTITIGLLMMLPCFINVIYQHMKERNDAIDR